MRRTLYYLFLATILVFFGAFFLFPVWQILRGGLTDGSGRPTAFYILETFRNPLYRAGLANSFIIAGGRPSCRC